MGLERIRDTEIIHKNATLKIENCFLSENRGEFLSRKLRRIFKQHTKYLNLLEDLN